MANDEPKYAPGFIERHCPQLYREIEEWSAALVDTDAKAQQRRDRKGARPSDPDSLPPPPPLERIPIEGPSGARGEGRGSREDAPLAPGMPCARCQRDTGIARGAYAWAICYDCAQQLGPEGLGAVQRVGEATWRHAQERASLLLQGADSSRTELVRELQRLEAARHQAVIAQRDAEAWGETAKALLRGESDARKFWQSTAALLGGFVALLAIVEVMQWLLR